MKIDINSDLGEGTGDDAALMDLITSANVACGFHAGDEIMMRETVTLAAARGVRIGAHPSFADREGFGRRPLRDLNMRAVENLVAYQIGALQGVAALAGQRITHVKPHGALSNMACVDFDLAKAIASAIRSVDRQLVFVVLPRSAMERAALDADLPVAREIYADRAYDDNAMLVSRDQPGAVIHDADVVAARVLACVRERAIVSTSGRHIPVEIDTVCIHGDTPGALDMARLVRQRLLDNGIGIAPFAS